VVLIFDVSTFCHQSQVLALAGVDGFSGEGKDTATSEDEKSRGKSWGKRDESAGTPYGFSARAIGKYVSNDDHDLSLIS
jgi:hypothetical protein